MLTLQQFAPPQPVDGSVLPRSHQPRARIIRDAGLRPLLESCDEGILRKLLGETYIAHHARQSRDDPRRLDPPDCFDRAMCIGSRHGYR